MTIKEMIVIGLISVVAGFGMWGCGKNVNPNEEITLQKMERNMENPVISQEGSIQEQGSSNLDSLPKAEEQDVSIASSENIENTEKDIKVIN